MKKLATFLIGAIFSVVIGASCAVAWHPDRVLFQPPSYYQVWWNEVADCLGMRANMDRVTFFIVPGVHSFEIPGVQGLREGLWESPHNIYIAQYNYAFKPLVKHEFVHDFLNPGHRDDPRFLECSEMPHYEFYPTR